MARSRIEGDKQLAELGVRLREAGDKGMVTELRKGMQRQMRPLARRIRAGSPQYTPGGYEQPFASSLRFQTKITTAKSTASVQLVTTAKGRKHPRQIVGVNEGKLRHPNWARGRRSTWTWSLQRIRPGFWSDPVREAKDDLIRAAREVMHQIGQKITKG